MLKDKGISARVVSMPCIEVFEQQSEEYRQSVLPDAIDRRVVVEAGTSFGWHKYAGCKGAIIALDTFGASGPAVKLFEAFDFTPENVMQKAIETLSK